MAVAYREIARVLDGARRRQVRIILLAAGGGGLATCLACLLAGAAAVLAGARPAVARPVALGGAGLALLGAAAWAVRAARRTSWTPEAAARTVAAGDASLRSDLVSAVELERQRDDIAATGRFSVALLDAHVDRTAGRAGLIDLARALPDRPARRGGAGLLAVAAATLAAFVVGGAPLGSAYRRLLAGDPPGLARSVVDPITGDVELTYLYPAYMRRDPATLSGTGGEVRAPRGTEVRLRTRADRPVARAEIAIDAPVPISPGEPGGVGRGEASREAPATQRFGLLVSNGRDLAGSFAVRDGGSYRFRFLDARGRAVAEGPPIPIVVEPDAFPEIRITAPAAEVEVDPGARLRIEWQAADDYGLGELTLVVKPPAGEERRRTLRTFASARRDAGGFDLELGPERLGEGERFLYWLEVTDTDTVSGPKRSASATHTAKIYSEAEHRRATLEQAKAIWEEMVALLGDRLEQLAPGPPVTGDRLALAEQLDARARRLHERMREAAAAMRKERAAPKEVAAALVNLAGTLRVAEQRTTAARQALARMVRIRAQPDPGTVAQSRAFDAQLDEELEKGILYLETLLDKRRAEDLVRLAKDLATRRRDLAGLLDRYRQSPTDAAKKDLLAQIQRMKQRMQELLARMAELSRGFNDEHMNAEALAEMERSKDVMGGLDEVERKLAQGDVEGAMKALDQLGSQMDQMLAGLQRTAGMPDEKARELMKDMLAFKKELEDVQADQQKVAGETEALRKEWRRKIEGRMKQAEGTAQRLQQLAQSARKDVEGARQGVSMRAEPDLDAAREGLEAVERALSMRDFDAAFESVQRSLPSMQRLAMSLEEDAAMAERYGEVLKRDPLRTREAQKKAAQAVPKAQQIRDELAKLFPDPKQLLGQGEQRRLDDLSQQQGKLERRAGELQQKLGELMQKAPVFPPGAQGQLGESRGHMAQAQGELAAKNPQRGHGEQQLAMDALERFRKGLEQAARQGGGSSGAQGFPFPFAEAGGEQTGDGADPSREKVEIPGAEAYKVPEEFRKDLLDAMRQGTPERYKGEVQRYYEELVK
ncbi:MAG TPA: hypothetical protein VLU43_15045 [Anaeromyxobacteraceae bacterium]|nr:hypothetical protein [Anaeromyxobacteraceae bacterium]